MESSHGRGLSKFCLEQMGCDLCKGDMFADIAGTRTVKVAIKSRLVTVEGPRGKLVKDLSHLAVNFSVVKKGVIGIEIHHGSRKNVATLRTVRTLINNLIIGVTKGFKYKMRYVYAHFPINVNVDKNAETGLWNVEIRYVLWIPGKEATDRETGGEEEDGLLRKTVMGMADMI